MNSAEIILQDRKDAGKKLAQRLYNYMTEKPIVLGMLRGGVAEVLQLLNLAEQA